MRSLCLSTLSLILLAATSTSFAADCKADAIASVEKACKLLAEKKEAAFEEIAKIRFCNYDYVWLQKGTFIRMHPVKPALVGKELKYVKAKDGMSIFIELAKGADKDPNGSWVDYIWPKPGEENPSPKTSFVKKCPGTHEEGLFAGAGFYK
ncbi:MAG: cache domain-containing protein [Oligoflexia bacterium]|nr:cache domain-containing protein [Oligoflexia bacterium]